ncbi:hypothetical protein MKW94_028346 [Papaver nudicaule]|nr:hypothetical protein [Papaver nudicaule]
MLNALIMGKDVSGDIIEFYMLRMQTNILKKLKSDGSRKYSSAVFLNTFAFTMHREGKKCAGSIDKVIAKMDEFIFIPLLTYLAGRVWHWTLLVFSKESGKFSHYNSLASYLKGRIISAFKKSNAMIWTKQMQDDEMQTPRCCQQTGNDEQLAADLKD